MNKEIRMFIKDEIKLEHIPGAVLRVSLQDKVRSAMRHMGTALYTLRSRTWRREHYLT